MKRWVKGRNGQLIDTPFAYPYTMSENRVLIPVLVAMWGVIGLRHYGEKDRGRRRRLCMRLLRRSSADGLKSQIRKSRIMLRGNLVQIDS